MMIKSSKLSLKFTNSGKLSLYSDFISEYRKAVTYYVDYLFHNDISFPDKSGNIKAFSIKYDLLDCPLFCPDIPYSSGLSARALKCAKNQALGIIKSLVSPRKRLLYKLQKYKEQRKRCRKVIKQLSFCKISYPNLSNINPELNSICCEIQKSNSKEFDFWLILKSIGKQYGKILIPLKSTDHIKKFQNWKMLNSALLTNNSVNFRFEKDDPKLKTEGKTVGADQGINTCLTLSDSQATPKDNHNHDLKSICSKISRKQKGSKQYQKALEHRKNYINWSINQLDFSDIKQVNLEDISNIKHKKRTSKYLNSWAGAEIKKKVETVCKENGVHLELQSCSYRSQRCSRCGYVCKKNRKGKNFSCKHCCFAADADLNASLNHEISLISIPFRLQQIDSKVGFFWKEDRILDRFGQEITVPVTKKSNI